VSPQHQMCHILPTDMTTLLSNTYQSVRSKTIFDNIFSTDSTSDIY